MAGHIQSAGRVDWNTPEKHILAIRQAFGGWIDLDPCSNDGSRVYAKREYRLDLHEDGLSLPWDADTIFVNPPFGTTYLDASVGLALSVKEWKALEEGERAHFRKTTIAQWVLRCVEAFQAGSEVILLLPAAPGTSHWQDKIFPWHAAKCWPRGRMRFVGAKASAPMDCAFVYFGRHADAFLAAFAPLGRVETGPAYSASARSAA